MPELGPQGLLAIRERSQLRHRGLDLALPLHVGLRALRLHVLDLRIRVLTDLLLGLPCPLRGLRGPLLGQLRPPLRLHATLLQSEALRFQLVAAGLGSAAPGLKLLAACAPVLRLALGLAQAIVSTLVVALELRDPVPQEAHLAVQGLPLRDDIPQLLLRRLLGLQSGQAVAAQRVHLLPGTATLLVEMLHAWSRAASRHVRGALLPRCRVREPSVGPDLPGALRKTDGVLARPSAGRVQHQGARGATHVRRRERAALAEGPSRAHSRRAKARPALERVLGANLSE
mmetsp:Transcript_16285/g.42091  ORF Transcript_16285/g.42091 Transcript_16285/m.42091 type:complete len:286 (+) Transcript_16285:301-1158(+)